MAPSRTYGSSSRPARRAGAPYSPSKLQASSSNISRASGSYRNAVASSSRATSRIQSPSPAGPELDAPDSGIDLDSSVPLSSTYKTKKRSNNAKKASFSSEPTISTSARYVKTADREEADTNTTEALHASPSSSHVPKSKNLGRSSGTVTDLIDIDDPLAAESGDHTVDQTTLQAHPSFKSKKNPSSNKSSRKGYSSTSSTADSGNAVNTNRRNTSSKVLTNLTDAAQPAILPSKRATRARSSKFSYNEASNASAGTSKFIESSKIQNIEEEDENDVGHADGRAKKRARKDDSYNSEDDEHEKNDEGDIVEDEGLASAIGDLGVQDGDAEYAEEEERTEEEKADAHTRAVKHWKEMYKKKQKALPSVNVGPTEAKGISQEEAIALVEEARKQNLISKTFALGEVGIPTFFVVSWNPSTFSKDLFYARKLLEDLSKQEGFPRSLALEISQKKSFYERGLGGILEVQLEYLTESSAETEDKA